MGSLVFPVMGNIYMEYFGEIDLRSQCPIPSLWWERYVNDIISIIKEGMSRYSLQPYKFYRFSNQICNGSHFAMMAASHSWIPSVHPASDHTIHTSLY